MSGCWPRWRRTIGDLAVAEDALSEATITALDAWPKTGIPDNPRAWLAVVARRKALDLLRRESARAAKETAAFRWGTGAAPDQIEEAIEAMEPETFAARRHAAPDLHLLPPGAWP